MKRSLVLITTAILLAASSAQAGWFDSKEEKLLIEAQQQLAQERQKTGTWQIVSGMLTIGCVSLLVLGTALGSKAKRAVTEATAPIPVSDGQPSGE